ncbi:MAG: MerR family transcriptional regulator [Betaproteobacteria bacterium]|nr:MAG: MerR family transcriptional regulator [Betaproteobacteria bacterium]
METQHSTDSVSNIAAVERDTGLSKDTLRVWERRYGFPVPLRDANGDRLYPSAQVEKLRLIRRLIDQGKRPAKVIGASTEELLALIGDMPDSSAAATANHSMLQYVRLHRSAELAAALRQALLKQGLQRFAAETVAPLNEAIGEAWMRGEIDVSEEHLYTEQVQNVLRGAIGAHIGAGTRPRVLLTTFPDEEHVLGLLMVEATLVAEGAHCLSLGTRTPLPDLRSAAVDGGFDVVGLSFSAAYPSRQAIDDLLQLRAMLPASIAMWAGGSAVKGKGKRLPDIRVVDSLADCVTALAEWRVAHLG